MSDFLDDLGRQLVERARQERPLPLRKRWSPRTVALAAAAVLALIAVPAAAVTGVFDGASHSRHELPAAPGLIDLGGGCTEKNPPRGKLTSEPPDQELLSTLGVLRRPQRSADRLSASRLGLQSADGVNPDYVRRVTSSSGLTGYLVPAQNIRFFPPTDCPNAPAPSLIKPQAGVCMRLKTGATCSTAAAIRSGYSLLTSGGSNHGTTLAAGIVPDGIKTVIWRVRRGTGFLDTEIPIRDNVYIGNFPGRKGHGLYVFWVDASGKKRLVRGPKRPTRAQSKQLARERALDRAAGPRPTITPRVGSGHTLFELRMRVANPQPGDIYGVTVTGRMPGDCGSVWVQRIGMQPAGRGDDRGLMRAGFGRSRVDSPWCPGLYEGVVRKGRSPSAPVVGRFAFQVTK